MSGPGWRTQWVYLGNLRPDRVPLDLEGAEASQGKWVISHCFTSKQAVTKCVRFNTWERHLTKGGFLEEVAFWRQPEDE